jgi:phage-related protein
MLSIRTDIGTISQGERPLKVHFYKTEMGAEPVRVWLQGLRKADRTTIGVDIKTVQFGWPLGMPLARHIDGDIWEIRSTLEERIARTLFLVDQGRVVLLHGFIKKDQRIPREDLVIAKDRLKKYKRGAYEE